MPCGRTHPTRFLLLSEARIPVYTAPMKITDDYGAKLDIWARNAKVCGTPKIANLPRFQSRKFRTYEEMNEWKRSLIDQMVLEGGVKWTKS